MEMKIFDPVTGETLDVWARLIQNGEAHIVDEREALVIIMGALGVDIIEAIRLLANSDPGQPIRIKEDFEIWTE